MNEREFSDAEDQDEERAEPPALPDLEIDSEDGSLIKGGVPKLPNGG